MMQVLAKWLPDIIIILGDFIDFDSLSSHDRDRACKTDAKFELDVASTVLGSMRSILPDAEIVYLEGNHEHRLRRYIHKNAAAFDGLLDLEQLLKLGELRVQFVPYKQTYRLGKLHLTHDTGKAGKNAHRQAALAHMGSTIIGHTHRMAYEVTGVYNAPPYLSAMFGWLGDATYAGHYTHEANAAEWVHGFGVAYVDQTTDIVYVQPVPIIGETCMVDGVLYTA